MPLAYFQGFEKTDRVEDEGVCGSAANGVRRKTQVPPPQPLIGSGCSPTKGDNQNF